MTALYRTFRINSTISKLSNCINTLKDKEYTCTYTIFIFQLRVDVKETRRESYLHTRPTGMANENQEIASALAQKTSLCSSPGLGLFLSTSPRPHHSLPQTRPRCPSKIAMHPASAVPKKRNLQTNTARPLRIGAIVSPSFWPSFGTPVRPEQNMRLPCCCGGDYGQWMNQTARKK